MRLIRFMSQGEFDALLAGETLHNTRDHHRYSGGRTNSIGFCFFDLSVPPEKRMEYLSGVVDMDAVIEIDTNAKLKKGQGIYRDPDQDEIYLIAAWLGSVEPPTIPVREYSLTEYSLDTCKVIRIGKPLPLEHKIIWEERA
jgi:hypothetical protein